MPRPDATDNLVSAKFSDYSIDRKSDSNNGRHYVLQKDGETFHLKLVSRKYIQQNDESEIELLKEVDSDYVVRLIDSGEINTEWDYMLFPHINGSTLDRLMVPEGWGDEKFSGLFHDVIEGFKALHAAGIIHRDIKPKNIMYDNVNQRYVILDLGIGCYSQNPTKDSTKIPRGVGAKYYTAPEQFKIAIDEPYTITQATDQFSLGVIAYELAVNQHPFITPSEENAQSYANLVFDVVPPQLPSRAGLSESTRRTIMKMLEKEQSARFLANDDLLVSYGSQSKEDTESLSKMYIKMPRENKEAVIEFANANPDTIQGIVITPTDGQDIADKLEEAGVNIILDTSVYNLQTAKEQKVLSKKLGIKYTANHNMLTLYRIRDELLMGVYDLADKMHSSIVTLPYFKIEGDESLILTREIWNEARSFYTSKSLANRPLYGGAIIPRSTVVNKEERTKLMSQLMGSYDLDGLIVTFEDTNTTAATTVTPSYVEGMQALVEFFETQFKNVIITRTDISVLPLAHQSSYVGGWSKSHRHFQASNGGGGNGATDYKMKYYAPKLFTFIEEKSLIRQIVVLGHESALECTCGECATNNPLASTYAEDEQQDRSHYYNCLSSLQDNLNGKTVADRTAYFIDYLNSSSVYGDEIKSVGAIGNETIPSYVGLVSTINS
jgi:serine/threonine protein kinase